MNRRLANLIYIFICFILMKPTASSAIVAENHKKNSPKRQVLSYPDNTQLLIKAMTLKTDICNLALAEWCLKHDKVNVKGMLAPVNKTSLSNWRSEVNKLIESFPEGYLNLKWYNEIPEHAQSYRKDIFILGSINSNELSAEEFKNEVNSTLDYLKINIATNNIAKTPTVDDSISYPNNSEFFVIALNLSMKIPQLAFAEWCLKHGKINVKGMSSPVTPTTVSYWRIEVKQLVDSLPAGYLNRKWYKEIRPSALALRADMFRQGAITWEELSIDAFSKQVELTTFSLIDRSSLRK